MRFFSALINDMRYQARYGFYFLYGFISAVYTAVLILCPQEYRKTAASIIILTDPAMIGAFFIGGIWLLEKGEGLHGFWAASPLRPAEYVLSKAVSLSVISTLAAGLIALAGLGTDVDYPVLLIAVFTGAMVFTLLGLLLASRARSINHYMLIASGPLTALLTPPIVAAFGASAPLLDITPGMALWRVIVRSIGVDTGPAHLVFLILLAWLGLFLFLANRRIPSAMETGWGEKP